MGWQEVGREDLYRKVWEKPLSHLAGEYGMSDVGLAKVCRRLGVPTPPVGYWAKVAAGQSPNIPPLPKATNETRRAVRIRVKTPGPDLELIAEPTVVVGKRLHRPHPLVREARSGLRRSCPDDYGRLTSHDFASLNIRVSRSEVSRALRVAQALICGIEDIGGVVEQRSGWRGKVETCAVIRQEEVRFSIWELAKRSVEPADGSRWSRDSYVYTPTGCLELRIEEYVSTGRPKTVRDRGPGKQVEDGLGRFIVSLDAVAQVMRYEREKRRVEDEERQRALIEQRERERREAYRDFVLRHAKEKAAEWRRADEMRSFLDAFEVSRAGKLNDQDRAWLKWLRNQIYELDPLSGVPTCSRPLQVPDEWGAAGG